MCVVKILVVGSMPLLCQLDAGFIEDGAAGREKEREDAACIIPMSEALVQSVMPKRRSPIDYANELLSLPIRRRAALLCCM